MVGIVKQFSIVCISRILKCAITDEGVPLPFIKMFFDGEETNNAQKAITAIVQLPSGEWYVVNLADHERNKLQ